MQQTIRLGSASMSSIITCGDGFYASQHMPSCVLSKKVFSLLQASGEAEKRLNEGFCRMWNVIQLEMFVLVRERNSRVKHGLFFDDGWKTLTI